MSALRVEGTFQGRLPTVAVRARAFVVVVDSLELPLASPSLPFRIPSFFFLFVLFRSFVVRRSSRRASTLPSLITALPLFNEPVASRAPVETLEVLSSRASSFIFLFIFFVCRSCRRRGSFMASLDSWFKTVPAPDAVLAVCCWMPAAVDAWSLLLMRKIGQAGRSRRCRNLFHSFSSCIFPFPSSFIISRESRRISQVSLAQRTGARQVGGNVTGHNAVWH